MAVDSFAPGLDGSTAGRAAAPFTSFQPFFVTTILLPAATRIRFPRTRTYE
jgi:hypothetical protein